MISLKVYSSLVLTWLWLISTCYCYKRSLADYAGQGYATNQANVAAALLRASLMFDEEGLQYPYYNSQNNRADKQLNTNYIGAAQQQQFYYYPEPTQATYSPAPSEANVVYGTSKTEDSENGMIFGRPREQTTTRQEHKVTYVKNNHAVSDVDVHHYGSEGAKAREGARAVYFQPVVQDPIRHITYDHYLQQNGNGYLLQNNNNYLQHSGTNYLQQNANNYLQQNSNNYIDYQQYNQQTPTTAYPTKTNHVHQFRPSDETYTSVDPLQHLDRPQSTLVNSEPTHQPHMHLDLLDKPHLSTTKQQALLTQYFKNVQAQTKDEEEEEEHKNEEEEASRYKFGYRITDSVTGMEYGQAEAREGEMTRGHYHVLLPDGRMQHVHYWSDDSGYHATISYDDGPRQTIS